MPALTKRKFQFDWKLTVLVLILLPVLLRLGFWQLDREAEKLHLQTLYAERQAEQSVPLEQLDADEDLQYRQIVVTGEYDNEHIFLLDNKIYQGQVGYEVIEPFVTSSTLVVFVNRGWIAQGRDRADLPEVDAINGKVQLRGSVYVPPGEQLTLGDIQPNANWPKVIQSLDVPQLAGFSTGAENPRIFPYSIRLNETTPGVLMRNWTPVSTRAEKHRAYAVQWFAMAVALVLLYVYYSITVPLINETAASDRDEIE